MSGERPEPHDAQTYYRVTREDGVAFGCVLNADRVAQLQAQGCTVTPWWVPEPVAAT